MTENELTTSRIDILTLLSDIHRYSAKIFPVDPELALWEDDAYRFHIFEDKKAAAAACLQHGYQPVHSDPTVLGLLKRRVNKETDVDS